MAVIPHPGGTGLMQLQWLDIQPRATPGSCPQSSAVTAFNITPPALVTVYRRHYSAWGRAVNT